MIFAVIALGRANERQVKRSQSTAGYGYNRWDVGLLVYMQEYLQGLGKMFEHSEANGEKCQANEWSW